jgi:hypothetical protein
MLEITAATLGKVWTGRINPICGWLQNLYRPRLHIILFLTDRPEFYFLSGEDIRNERHLAVRQAP